MKSGHVKLYGKLKYIYEHGYAPLLIRFTKIDIFHITFECLISVYALELIATLTKFFLVDPTSIPKLLVLVFLPSISVIITSLLYGAVCSYVYINSIYGYATDYIQLQENLHLESIYIYYNVIRKYRKQVIVANTLGILIYSFTTAFFPYILVSKYSYQFYDPQKFVLCMSIIGTLFGIIWNVTGFFRNQRLVWHKLIPIFQEENIQSIIWKRNFNLLWYNFIGNIVSLIFLLTLSLIIIFNIHPTLLLESNFRELITDYNFFLFSFVVLVAYYVRGGFTLLYSSKNSGTCIFPPLVDILEQK